MTVTRELDTGHGVGSYIIPEEETVQDASETITLGRKEGHE